MTARGRQAVGALLLVLAMGALLGCNPPKEEEGGKQATTQVAKQQAREIVIGADLELTGPTATFGQSALKGIKMAVDEINAAGGIKGARIKLLEQDNKGQSQEAVNVAKKFAYQDQVDILVGAIASTLSIKMAAVAEEAELPMVTPASTNPAVTVDNEGNVRKWVFRATFTDDFQGEILARFVYEDLGAKRIAIFYDAGQDYSKGVYQRVKDVFTSLGGEVVAEATFTQEDIDFRAKLTKFKESDFDVLVVSGYYDKAGLILKQAREVGLDKQVVGPDGFDSEELITIAGEAANGVYFTTHFAPDDPDPKVQKFVQDYKARYGGEDPDAIAVLGYDAMYIIKDALMRAESFSRADIRDALETVKEVSVTTGTVTIDQQHNAFKPLVIVKIVDGKRSFFKRFEPPREGQGSKEETPAGAGKEG